MQQRTLKAQEDQRTRGKHNAPRYPQVTLAGAWLYDALNLRPGDHVTITVQPNQTILVEKEN